MHIQAFEDSMAESVDDLVRAAFTASKHGYGGESELVNQLRVGSTKTCEIVALDNGNVIGHAMLSEAKVADTTGMVLAPISVLPSEQGRGVGKALMCSIEELARNEGVIFISVLGDFKYYGRFGYVDAARFGVHPPDGIPEEFFLLKVLDSKLRLNGTLIYAPEFGI